MADRKISYLKPTAESGVSLVELMVVVAISAILAALAPIYGGNLFGVSSGSEDIERLRSAMTSVRNSTILSSACATATVDTSANTLTAAYFSTCGPPPDYLLPSVPNNLQTYSFHSIALNDFNVGQTLKFIPGGGTSAAKPATMQITTKNSQKTNVLTVLPAIGNIRISL